MPANALQRLLGKGFSIAACVGLVIGLGILRTPGEIATTVNEPVPYMALWIACGLFVLLSLLVVAELIAMTPRSGGIYALVAHAYGPYPGFLIGWTDWVAACASMALKAVVLLEYVVLLEPRLAPYQTATAVAMSTGFALLQLRGVKVGAGIQQFASTVMGLIMISLAVALFYGFFANGGPVDAAHVAVPLGDPGWAAYGLVVAAVVFTYDGWYAASYFSGEVRSGGRSVAIGSLQAALIVMALYVALNLALILSVPLGALIGHDLALAGALDLVYGAGAGTVVIFMAIFILLAHQNLQYMVASRVLFSLSEDGLGTRRATGVNEKGTPAGAVILTWLLTISLIIVGQFELLLSLVTIFFMAMYVGLVIGVFKLRRQEPVADRPFRAWGFPATGVICTVGWTAVAVFVAITNPDSTLYGGILTVVSVPVYLFLKRHRRLGEVST
ncbi:MAG: amino acid permease [Woeseiaceae bacterium]|nr:amino acid permease [Woeseiaceae bacterium]NIP20078.1 amino acid permease [Woeseiaceae bacterium]NIS88874.1 amino acid permease [Woeseiaceae bacterium]